MIDINNIDTFNEIIAKKQIVLADFWASWCGPCRMLLPVLEEVSREITNIEIVKINVDEAAELAEKFEIQSVPTMILFKNGSEVSKKSGFISKNAILAWIQEIV